MTEFATAMRTAFPAPVRRPSFTKHSSHCSICRHPRRSEIERDFLEWWGPREIARRYGLGSHTTVYRHAHALGLFVRRRRALQIALRLGRLIEQAGDWESVEASVGSAVRLLARGKARRALVKDARSLPARGLPDSAHPEETRESHRGGDRGPGGAAAIARRPRRSPAGEAGSAAVAAVRLRIAQGNKSAARFTRTRQGPFALVGWATAGVCRGGPRTTTLPPLAV
jgi:hypothetical protein